MLSAIALQIRMLALKIKGKPVNHSELNLHTGSTAV